MNRIFANLFLISSFALPAMAAPIAKVSTPEPNVESAPGMVPAPEVAWGV